MTEEAGDQATADLMTNGSQPAKAAWMIRPLVAQPSIRVHVAAGVPA
jgi:hypothetical protein